MAAFIGTFTFTSCNKKYACVCTALDPAGTTHNVTAKEISATSKNKAEDECKKYDHIIGNLTTRCYIE